VSTVNSKHRCYISYMHCHLFIMFYVLLWINSFLFIHVELCVRLPDVGDKHWNLITIHGLF